MLATLPMYDWPEIRPATDRFWDLIRDGLRAQGIMAPDTLHRGDRWNDWEAPDLVLSQTCGFPYRTKLHGKIGLIGPFDFGLPGAAPGYYYSQLVVRADDDRDWTQLLGARLAINGHDSQSGWAAPQNHAATIGGRFTDILVTGAHKASAQAVADGQADIAAIDARTWALIDAHLPDLAARLRIAAHTAPTPGLPLITARTLDPAAIAAAVRQAIAGLSSEDRAALGILGLADVPAEAYLAVPTPELG